MGARLPPVVFVWHPGSLGDVLLALPAIRALRTAYPRHDLLLAAQGEIGTVLRACAEIDGVFSIGGQGLADLCGGSAAVRGALGEALGRCEVAVCWLADHDDRVRRALDGLRIPLVVVRSPHASGVQAVHQSERFLETLGPLGAAVPVAWEPLGLPPQAAEEGRRRLRSSRPAEGGPRVVIHPGSGSPHKCCAATLQAERITRLRGGGLSPVLLVGPADGEVSARVLDLVPVPVPALRGLDLAQAAGVLAAADLYIGHDSGITHLAAAVGVPTVALFGPTPAARWAPRGQAVAALTGPPCRCDGWPAIRACLDKPCLMIPVESVLSTCRQGLSCRATGRTTASA